MNTTPSGTTYNPGDVLLASLPYSDIVGFKFRPAVVLFEFRGNIIVAPITSNPNMVGIPVGISDGLRKESTIKFNSIFTITTKHTSGKVSSLSRVKRKLLFETLFYHMQALSA